MSYASLLENNSERATERLWNPNRRDSLVKGGPATGLEASKPQGGSLATLPIDSIRRLYEPGDRRFEDPRFRDMFAPPRRFEATNKQLRRELRNEKRLRREAQNKVRELKLGLEMANNRIASDQARISKLTATLTQLDSENRRLRQEIDARDLKEGMRDVQPFRHSA